MSLDPHMAALAARTAAAWRAEQRPDEVPSTRCGCGHLVSQHKNGSCQEMVYGEGRGASQVVVCPCVNRSGASHEQRPDALPFVTAATARILIPALQVTRPELVHFAGAAHRDPMALEVCREYQRDPTASEPDLRARARATVYGGGR